MGDRKESRYGVDQRPNGECQANELNRFLKHYEHAANSCNFDNVEPLIAEDAVFWFTNGTYVGRRAIRGAFVETWSTIKDETYSLADIKWLGVSETVAVCVYDFTSDGIVNGRRQV